MPLLRDGKISEDARAFVADEAPLPSTPAIISFKRFAASPESFLAGNQAIALRLQPDDAPEAICEYLERIDLIEIAFPKYSDGRGFSQAQVLRRRLGYAGELRAVGDVLRDQIGFMVRTGFNAMVLEADEPESVYLDAAHPFSDAYQGAADGGQSVFLRRHAVSETAPTGRGDSRKS